MEEARQRKKESNMKQGKERGGAKGNRAEKEGEFNETCKRKRKKNRAERSRAEQAEKEKYVKQNKRKKKRETRWKMKEK